MRNVLRRYPVLMEPVDIAIGSDTIQAIVAAKFSALPVNEITVELCLFCQVVIDADLWLVVVVEIRRLSNKVVAPHQVLRARNIWQRYVLQNCRGRRVNHRSRKSIAGKRYLGDVIAVARRHRTTVETIGASRLINGQPRREFCGIQLLHQCEIYAGISVVTRPQECRRYIGQQSAGARLPVALKAEEGEKFILDNRAAGSDPELVLCLILQRRSIQVVRECIRTHQCAFISVARIAVILVATTLRHHIHRAATGSAEAGIVGRSHHVHFLDAVDIRRNRPLTRAMIAIAGLAGDVRSVQCELVIADDAATDGVTVRDVPAACAGITARPCLRCELAARCGPNQRVSLAAIQRHVGELARIDNRVTRTI